MSNSDYSSDSEEEICKVDIPVEYWDLYYGIKQILYDTYAYSLLDNMTYFKLESFIKRNTEYNTTPPKKWLLEYSKEIKYIKELLCLNNISVKNFENFCYTVSSK